MDSQNQSSGYDTEGEEPVVCYTGPDNPEIQNLVAGLKPVRKTMKAFMRPVTEEESKAYAGQCDELQIPQHRFSSRSLRRLIHLCLFLQLGLMIGNWIWYWIELENSTVTQSHKLLHGAFQSYLLPEVFARNLFNYSRDNRSGTCRELGITNMVNQTAVGGSLTLSLLRYGIESSGETQPQPQFENPTLSHHDLKRDCDLVSGLHAGTLWPALGSCIVLILTFIGFKVSEVSAQSEDNKCNDDDDNACIDGQSFTIYFLYGFFTWKILIFCSLYNIIKSSTEIMDNLMKADTLQIFDETVPSLTWDRTQLIGQCCGIQDYNFWSFNSSLDGYPKSCCNNLLFDCDSLGTVTVNEVWKTGCLDSEVANVIWGLVPRIIFQFVDIIVEVCLLFLMNYHYVTLSDETKEQNQQRAKGMKRMILTLHSTVTYKLPPNKEVKANTICIGKT